MSTVTITQGFSGSGKSTWADKEILASKGKIVGVNRDMLRMMTGRKWFPADEDLVSDIAQAAIVAALGKGKDVIVDDTFINLKLVEHMKLLASRYNVDFAVKSFMHVPLHECIKRDAARDRSVGKDVIEQQYARWWKQQEKPANTGVPAIIVDIDGTLAHADDSNRQAFYNRDRMKDTLDLTIRDTVHALRGCSYRVLLTSGRGENERVVTKAWLEQNGVLYDELFMRGGTDLQRDDATVKKELYMNHIQGKYHIVVVLDDRPRVVRMWRHELGLKVLHVADNWEF